MRAVVVLFIGLALAPGVIAQNSAAIRGEWLITRDAYGNPLYQRMTLTVQNGKLTGLFAGDKTISAGFFVFVFKLFFFRGFFRLFPLLSSGSRLVLHKTLSVIRIRLQPRQAISSSAATQPADSAPRVREAAMQQKFPPKIRKARFRARPTEYFFFSLLYLFRTFTIAFCRGD